MIHLWPLPPVPIMSLTPMMAASSARVTRLRHQSIMGRLHVSHKSQILLWASPVSPQPGPASSWPSHKITLEGYPRIHTSDFLMSSRNGDYVYLWALHYHKEGATRSLVSTLFVFIRLLFSTFSFSPRSIPGFETGTTLLMITPLMKILKIHHPLSQRVWVRCRERCGNLKIGNFWIKWGGERVPYFWCGENFILQPSKSNFLTAFGDELNSHSTRRKIIHSRIQYNFLNTTAISCKKKLHFSFKKELIYFLLHRK